MPDIVKKENGDMDWGKFFMAMAAGAVIVMQAYSQMQHNITREKVNTIEEEVVPRQELLHQTVAEHNDLVQRLDRAIKELEHRLDRVEK